MADPHAPRAEIDVLVGRMQALERRIADLESPSGTQQAQAVRRLPLQDFQVAQAQPIGLSAGYQTYASVTLTVPDGRTRLQLLAIGSAAVLDQTSGGVTSSMGRLMVDSVASREFPAAKDAGSSKVNNVIIATQSAVLDVTGRPSIRVDFQLNPLNAAAFPSHSQNFAQLTVLGAFTIV